MSLVHASSGYLQATAALTNVTPGFLLPQVTILLIATLRICRETVSQCQPHSVSSSAIHLTCQNKNVQGQIDDLCSDLCWLTGCICTPSLLQSATNRHQEP